MADYTKIIPFIKKWEGKYVNNKNDRGGCTNSGVTISTFQSFYGKNMTCTDLKALTENQWMNIFKKGFWDKCHGDNINDQSVANILVDFYWGSGIWAFKHLQKCLGVKQDGQFGNITLSALNSSNGKDLFDCLKKERENFYYSIVSNHPSQKIFLKGWLNRVDSLQYNSGIYGSLPKISVIKNRFKKILKLIKFYNFYIKITFKDFYKSLFY